MYYYIPNVTNISSLKKFPIERDRGERNNEGG